MGKTSHKEKTLPGEFQVTTLKNLLIKNHGYKYKEFYHHPGLSQNTNLQLNLYSNLQLDLIL